MESLESQRSERAAGERRRCVRHKIHTPAYASLDEKPELSEILDISEEGVAIQTSSRPELNQTVDVCLDLSETNKRIRASGRVVRVDGSGRAAIRFPDLPESSRQQLQEWLFLNAIMAGVNQIPAPDERPSEDQGDEFHSDFTSRLTALSAVDREVQAMGADLDGALELIAKRALSFTSATGAAIALSQGIDMICVASSGAQAPPLESRLQAGSGFSGECVRTATQLRCDDAEKDARVDQESCRAMGIRSMIATPIVRGNGVIGLLEVFSPKPGGFHGDAETVLKHLSGTATAVISRAGLESMTSMGEDSVEQEIAVEDGNQVAWSFPHKLVLICAIAILVLGIMILLTTPWKKAPAPRVEPAAVQSKENSAVNPLGQRLAQSPGDVQSLLAMAKSGDSAAEFAVGERYATGREVKQDYAEAIRWFTLAAEQGHIVSQATLGAYYWAGRGVPPDLEKAYYWSILAQNGGDQASKYRVAVLTSRMTPAQVSTAQQRAEDWMKQHRGISQAVARERLPQ